LRFSQSTNAYAPMLEEPFHSVDDRALACRSAMRTSFVLKQAEDGSAVAEVCRKAGISEATFYNWRKRYAGLLPTAS
jgi:Transposase